MARVPSIVANPQVSLLPVPETRLRNMWAPILVYLCMGAACLFLPAISAPITGLVFLGMAGLTAVWIVNQTRRGSVPLDIWLTHCVTFFPGFPCLIGVIALQAETGGYGLWFDLMVTAYVVGFAVLCRREAYAMPLHTYANILRTESALETTSTGLAMQAHFPDSALRKARGAAFPFVGWTDLIVIIVFLAVIPALQLIVFGPSGTDARLGAAAVAALALPWVFRGNLTALILNLRLHTALQRGDVRV